MIKLLFLSIEGKDIFVAIKNPQGKSIKPIIKKNDESYLVNFTPDECGPYSISVKYADYDVDGSPFMLKAHPTGDATKCKFTEIVPKDQQCGKKNKMTVNAKEAGPGAVTCHIKSDVDR